MVNVSGADTSPARLAQIESMYIQRTTSGKLPTRLSLDLALRDVLAMLYEARAGLDRVTWRRVKDGLPPLVDGQKVNVDIKATSLDGKVSGRWFGRLHWHDPPQFTDSGGHLIVVNEGETWWRPL